MSKSISQQRYPRRFVSTTANMGDWSQIEPYFNSLDVRIIDTIEQLEIWILDCSELASCLSEEYNKRYVAMTCQTDDKSKERSYLEYIENIQPKSKQRWHKLNKRFVESELRSVLSPVRYHMYNRSKENSFKLFRDENVVLQTKDNTLDQQYQKICGAMTVEYDGQEQTLQQMVIYQQEPNREVRKDAWTKVAYRRLADRDVLDDIYDQMIRLRTQIARNAGFENFRDYQFLAYERFDYTPQHCFDFHNVIQNIVVPVYREIQRERRHIMGIDLLRPWDLAVDPMKRSPLRPFNKATELYQGCSAIFHRIDSQLGEWFDDMVTAGWLDVESRKGKAPGGYQATFDEARHPFIFMNAVGLHRDVETLLHEGGHAFHCIACREEPILEYRHCGMEMAEVASMGMELLAYEHLDVFYGGDDLVRARREQLEGIVSTLCWIATIDAFQHWIYLQPDHSRRERTEYWHSLLERFGGIEDWTGYLEVRESLWQRQLHLYGVPFYYIEYGIAQIGALQLWLNSRLDRNQTIKKYRDALALGGSLPLPELWKVAGIEFSFKEEILRPLIDAIQSELRTL